jgi:hypothetical protein
MIIMMTIRFLLALIVEVNRVEIERDRDRLKNKSKICRKCLIFDQLLGDSLVLKLARDEFMHARFLRINAQLARY